MHVNSLNPSSRWIRYCLNILGRIQINHRIKRVIRPKLNIWIIYVNRFIQTLSSILLWSIQSFDELLDSWSNFKSLVIQNEINLLANDCCRRWLGPSELIFSFDFDVSGFILGSFIENTWELFNDLSFHLIGDNPGFSGLVIEYQVLNCVIGSC